MLCDKKPMKNWTTQKCTTNNTVTLESIMILGMIDSEENRDIMGPDIPNAFIQAQVLPLKRGKDRQEW